MTGQYSTPLRNDLCAAKVARIGASPVLRIRSGAQPANAAAARSGTVLGTLNLGATPFGTPSGGVVSKSATPWLEAAADAPGDPGHFEFMDSAGTVCNWQGICAVPWQANRNYVSVGAHVINDSGKVYRLTTAGVAAASGGPTGTGATINDGTAVWTFVAASAAAIGAMVLNAPVTAGVAVTVDTFDITAPGA